MNIKTCKNCKYFERQKWHHSIDPNENDQFGGNCKILDEIILMNNYFLHNRRIYIQDSFGCIAYRDRTIV